MKTCQRILLIMSLLVFCQAIPALAHKINVFAYAEAGQVMTESYFADGRPVKQSRVRVYDSSEALLLEGKTDDQGLFNCPIPKVDTLTIEVRELLGHRNTYILRKPDIAAASMPAQDSR